MTGKAVVDFYDNFAKSYDDEVFSEGIDYREPQAVFKMVKPVLKPEYKTFLDLGVGTGLIFEMFSDLGLEIYGVDLSVQMVEEARKKNIAKEVVQRDLSDGVIPFPDVAFDIVSGIGFLEFLPEIGPLFESIRNSLTDGGIYFFSYPIHELNEGNGMIEMNGLKIQKLFFERKGVIARYRREKDILDEIEQCGFSLVDRETVVAYRSPTSRENIMKTVFLVEKR